MEFECFRLQSGKSFAFSGDTNGDGDSPPKIAKDADAFIAHNAVHEGATGVERELHMAPSIIGKIAAEAQVGHPVLSHRMPCTVDKETEAWSAGIFATSVSSCAERTGALSPVFVLLMTPAWKKTPRAGCSLYAIQ